MTKSKSFNKSPKQRALYHALMESILKDEDAIDEGVADKLKKRKPDDADKDEGLSAGSDQREDMCNTDEPPDVNVDLRTGLRNQKDLILHILSGIKDRLTTFSKALTEVISSSIIIWKNVSKQNHRIVPVDYFFNNDLAYLQGGSTGKTYMTSLTKRKAAKYDLPGIEDMVPNL
nr:hypothetical protein [Tanacetum cinerariifolium]